MQSCRRIGIIFLVTSLCFLLSSCSQSIPKPILDSELGARPTIIFIPGFKGTKLLDAQSGEVVWINEKTLHSDNLAVALNANRLGIRNAPQLKHDSILRELGLFFGLQSIEVYSPYLAFLHSAFGETHQIYEFAYDWRQDITHTAKKLDRLVKSLVRKGITDISIISHSMGGLVATYYLRYGASEISKAHESWEGGRHIDRLVLMGTPFRGAMVTFHDVLYGVKTGENKSLLNKTAFTSLASTYQLLPIDDGATVLSKSLEPIKNVIHSPRNWRRCRWGMMDNPAQTSSAVLASRLAYIESNLENGSRFQQLLHQEAENRALAKSRKTRILNIVGREQKTPAQAVWLGRNCGRFVFDASELKQFYDDIWSDFLYADGDGTITAFSASIPTVYRGLFSTKSVETYFSHRDFILDESVQSTIKSFMSS